MWIVRLALRRPYTFVVLALLLGLWLRSVARQPRAPVDRAPTPSFPGRASDPGTDESFPLPFGEYSLIRRIGKGGMAVVYQARHRAFHEIVAIKVVHPQFLNDSDFLKRFRNEAVVARKLKHPHAVRIDDFDYTEDGRPFIVMEFVEGRSIDQLREQHPGPWPVDRCLSIAAQAASALGAAHTLGIVHRDIKPSNILLLPLPDGAIDVKVLDFGIAKVTGVAFPGMTTVETQQSFIIGTPEYMSPEQASGRIEGFIDGRADLYSLGLVLYEMLTGAQPFKADTPMGMLVQQVHTLPPPPDSIAKDIPHAVSELVLKDLQKRPEDRFQSASELIEAIQNPAAWLSAQSGEAKVTVPAPLQQPAPATQTDAQTGSDEAPPIQPAAIAELAQENLSPSAQETANSIPADPKTENQNTSVPLGESDLSRGILVLLFIAVLVGVTLWIASQWLRHPAAPKSDSIKTQSVVPALPTPPQSTTPPAPQTSEAQNVAPQQQNTRPAPEIPREPSTDTAVPMQRPAAVPSHSVKVSEEVMNERFISKEDPIDPKEALAEGIHGDVVLRIVVSKTGRVQKADFISGPYPLRKSAFEAVIMYLYKPYLVNGQPVEVETTATVHYNIVH